MSMELYVFLNKCDMPEPKVWQNLISQAGFDLQLDHDFDPFVFTGFLPCLLDDRKTGYEYYFSPKTDVAAPDTYLAPLVRDFDSVVTFRWGGDLREMCAAMMAAGALSASVSSLLHLPEDDSSVSGTEALSYARQQIAEAQKYLKS